jgi:uncharacterized protein YbjT (DUF2867 family)
MIIAISTPTGNIGRQLAHILRDAGEKLVLMVRDPDKIQDLTGRDVTVTVGSLEDTAFVTAATRGVDALFWVTPPNYRTEEFRKDQNKLGRHAAAAVAANGVPRVVNISSIGAHLADGTGPIAGLHDVEGHFGRTEAAVTHLRPGFFMENYLEHLDSIHQHGAVFLPCAGTTAVDMIATVDIAAEAARILRDESWSGQRVVELVGPAPTTFDDAARSIGEAIGREVKHATITPEQARETMGGMGLPAAIIEVFLEMYAAMDSGLIVPEGTPLRTGTSLGDFAAQKLAHTAAAED